ncbi:MAG: hypothetical protein U1F49_12545 [Rubrivivax sp.]
MGLRAVYYGRWVHWHGRWCWAPGGYIAAAGVRAGAGGVGRRAGPGVSINPGPTVGWVPLAPRLRRCMPYYRATPVCVNRVNITRASRHRRSGRASAAGAHRAHRPTATRACPAA